MSSEDKRTPGAGTVPVLSEEDRLLLAKYEHHLTGSTRHSLDSKGRMVVPSEFRDSLGAGFCIAPSTDFKSIALYSAIGWVRLRESYERLRSRHSSLVRFLERFDAYSYRGQECDAQGRVLLPLKLRQLVLGEEKDVEISGAGDHIRVAAARRDSADMETFLAELPDILQDIDHIQDEADRRGSGE